MGSGNLLTGIGTIMLGVGSIAAFILTWRRTGEHGRRIEHVTKKVEGIDEAVNQVEPGQPTLSKRMDGALRAIDRVETTTLALKRDLVDTRRATGEVLDQLNAQSASEHHALWDAVRSLGYKGARK